MKFLIVSTFKPLVSEQFLIEQTNALQSWIHLDFGSDIEKEIVIFGSDQGVPEMCSMYNVKNVVEVAKNNKGVPLINDILRRGSEMITYEDLIMYINGDIILCQDFVDTIRSFISTHRAVRSCLLTCMRFDLYDYQLLDFVSGKSINDQLSDMSKTGKWSEPSAIDLFIFKKDNYERMPDFAVSRLLFDTWMVDYAVKNFEMTVNMTPTVTVYHQYGKWYHDNKIVDRPDWNSEWWLKVDYDSVQKNILLAGNPNYRLVTNCRYISKINPETREITFVYV